ncbi:MAG: YfaZ family outer membrane protein [Steroidobacteraceae bacterium]
MRAIALGIAAIAGLFAATHSQAQSLRSDRPHGEVALSDETLQLRYVDNGDQVDVGEGARASGSFFLSESRDIVLNADLLFPADFDYDSFQLLFGPRAYAALLEDENSDVLTLALGAEMRFELDRRTGLAIAGQAFYAPDILTFGNANSLTDLSARLEFRLQEKLTVFGGMRWFEFDLTEGEGVRTLQEELFAGLSWQF